MPTYGHILEYGVQIPLLYSIPAPNCGYLFVQSYEYRHTSIADGYTGHAFAFTRTISAEGAMEFPPPLIGLLHRNDNVPCVLLRHLLLIDMRTFERRTHMSTHLCVTTHQDSGQCQRRMSKSLSTSTKGGLGATQTRVLTHQTRVQLQLQGTITLHLASNLHHKHGNPGTAGVYNAATRPKADRKFLSQSGNHSPTCLTLHNYRTIMPPRSCTAVHRIAGPEHHKLHTGGIHCCHSSCAGLGEAGNSPYGCSGSALRGRDSRLAESAVNHLTEP